MSIATITVIWMVIVVVIFWFLNRPKDTTTFIDQLMREIAELKAKDTREEETHE